MIHLGDITKIHGGTAPAVDVVIGGSPCQDLSIAGKRAGLAGERSGLYMEQIRVIREMRENDRANGRSGEFICPRFMVWENVLGALSSNHGKDFAAVLEEAIRVVEPEAPPVPVPEKGWPTSGCLMGDGWSVAWRVLDAQFWGVPQRRRRIALVADFGGHTAPEILFIRKGLSGDSEPGGTAGEGFAGSPESGTASNGGQNRDAVLCLNDQGGSVMSVSEDVAATLRAQEHGHQPAVLVMSHACDVVRDCGGIAPSLQARMGTGGNQVPLALRYTGFAGYKYDTVAGTLMATAGKRAGDLVCATAVRRLTPLECERLQGFPDGWTNIGDWVDSKGKKRQTTDSARYKALGNSIALPPWKWVLKRLCAQYERDATMASLFDGIGGFQLIWEQLNGKGSCLWASEIEEFPIAVTKKHFG